MTWKHHGNEVKELPSGCAGFLYMIITPEDRYYIGQCTQMKYWKQYYGSGLDLKRYYAENGKDNTRRNILRFYDCELELDAAEKKLCQMFDAKDNPLFYNLTDGGKSNAGVSAKTKIRQSKAKKGNKNRKGKKVSAKAKAQISATLSKKFASGELSNKKSAVTKARITEGLKRYWARKKAETEE